MARKNEDMPADDRSEMKAEGGVQVDASNVTEGTSTYESQSERKTEVKVEAGEGDADEQPRSQVAEGASGRSKVKLARSAGKVTTKYGVFVMGEEVAVNAEAKNALLEMRDSHGRPLFEAV